MEKEVCKILPLGSYLSALTKSYFGAFSKRLNHIELERYYSILILLEANENKCTQQFICDNLMIDKVSMVRIIDILVKKKYVKKAINKNDRREHIIQLTKKSFEILPELHIAVKEINSAAFANLSHKKIEELYVNLKLIQKNLELMPSEKIFLNYKKSNKKI